MSQTIKALTLKDLPAPPTGKDGFPWTEQSEPLPEKMPDGSDWPKISIVTPSYNQGHFIEETIRSILLQSYPNLEYIIIDGGSSDNTVKIIRKYERFLTYWVSEDDHGQAHAINKGLEKATGSILAYLNSDDYYLPNTLFKVAKTFVEHAETDLLHGQCRYVNEVGDKIGEQFGNIETFEEIIDLWGVWWQKRQFVQPEVFWSKRAGDCVGKFRESLHYVMDYEYWLRILLVGGKVRKLNAEISCFRFTNQQKSNHSADVANELLYTVYPLIWDKRIKLGLFKRLSLQGKWLYQSKFLEQVRVSLDKGDHKVHRWLKSGVLLFLNPQIIFVPAFRGRLSRWLIKITKKVT